MQPFIKFENIAVYFLFCHIFALHFFRMHFALNDTILFFLDFLYLNRAGLVNKLSHSATKKNNFHSAIYTSSLSIQPRDALHPLCCRCFVLYIAVVQCIDC